MKYSIYQIQSEYDSNRVMYQGYETVYSSALRFPSGIYEKVYDGEGDFHDLEDIYKKFNGPLPEDYSGRSLSVSDVLTISDPCGSYEAGTYFCDHVGWQELPDFCPDEVQPSRVSCLYMMPGTEAQSMLVSPSLSRLQDLCYGNIECVHYFEESNLVLVCNEDGKLMNLPPCRAFFQDGQVYDVVAGPFLIMQEDPSGSFTNLDPALMDKYMELYKSPEFIHVEHGDIVVEKLSLHREDGKEGPEL